MCLKFFRMTKSTRRLPSTSIAVNGPALRELRIRTGVPLDDFAHRVGVHRSFLTKIELGYLDGGRLKRVSPATFAAMLRELGIQDRRTLLANVAEDPAVVA